MRHLTRMFEPQRGMIATLTALVILVVAALALLGARAVAVAGWMAATAA